MDLRIAITDENGDVVEHCTIYQDGSDREGAKQIIEMIRSRFKVEKCSIQNTEQPELDLKWNPETRQFDLDE